MVDLTLEEFQRNQSTRISREIIGQSEEHEQKMQANAQKLWENAHKHLVALLRFLDQDYDESCEKATRPLESFSDDDLAYLIHVRLRTLQGPASKKIEPLEINELKQRLKELNQKYADLEQELIATQESRKSIQAEKEALETHLSAIRQAQKEKPFQDNQSQKILVESSEISLVIPHWIKTWKSTKGFEKTSTAILVMGEMGVALRPSVIKMIAKRLSLPIVNHSLDEAINRLLIGEENVHPRLIEKIEGISEKGSSSGGNIPDVLRLTKDGNFAYRVLTGANPKQNDYDRLIKSHSSPEHTILNLQAAEFLVEQGYLLTGQAQEIHLSNGGTFFPDISVMDPSTGELIFIEVERDVHKDQVTRKQKWINLFEASNGSLYVFCDNLTGQRAIQGEINLALGGLSYNSFLTNLHGLRNGKRSEKDGSIWLSVKRGK
ncbi:MAG: hypothetical protein GX457_18375 [Thermotogaceae bacterium]|nr:hypothetical protein [Thermotogaceae bacterium]